MNQARVRSGMMFAAVPPSWMIPWTRTSVGSCCRHSPTELNSRIIASRAFLPRHGSAAACACSPWNTISTSSEASGNEPTWLRSQGWKRSAASTPSKRPSSIMNCLPLPRSSAGVPRKTISPAISSARAARPIAAPTPLAAIVLWPQPWPSPGSASYSARTAIRGPSPPRPPRRVARIAVARRPAGCSTSKPCLRRVSATQAAAWCSSKAGSGSAWIRCERSRISWRAARIARRPGVASPRPVARPGRPRRGSPDRRRDRPPGPTRRQLTWRWGWSGLLSRVLRSGCVAEMVPGPGDQRSTDSVASARITSATMNRAIGGWNTPCRRRMTKIVTTTATQAPRRTARVQSPR